MMELQGKDGVQVTRRHLLFKLLAPLLVVVTSLQPVSTLSSGAVLTKTLSLGVLHLFLSVFAIVSPSSALLVVTVRSSVSLVSVQTVPRRSSSVLGP